MGDGGNDKVRGCRGGEHWLEKERKMGGFR